MDCSLQIKEHGRLFEMGLPGQQIPELQSRYKLEYWSSGLMSRWKRAIATTPCQKWIRCTSSLIAIVLVPMTCVLRSFRIISCTSSLAGEAMLRASCISFPIRTSPTLAVASHWNRRHPVTPPNPHQDVMVTILCVIAIIARWAGVRSI